MQYNTNNWVTKSSPVFKVSKYNKLKTESNQVLINA